MEIKDLKNKTLGIVSSYSDLCGNATYTKQLMEDLAKFFKKVECVELDQRLIHSELNYEAQKEVTEKVKQYDFINIQCEPGLFHKKARAAIKFIGKIIDARNGENISITFHSVGISSKVINMSKLEYKLFKIKLSLFKKERRSFDVYRTEQSLLLSKIKKLQKSGKNISIIVHQKELAEQLSLSGIESYFHPIVSASNKDIIKFNNENIRNNVLDKYNLDKSKTYVGCYGFYGPYKGVDVLIKAISLLPENYQLIISSNCHPVSNLRKRSITGGGEKNRKLGIVETVEQDYYMQYLMKLIIKSKISDKVHFINHIIDEEDFKELIASTDISVFPYYEVGQQGSGPVSYATHLSYSGKIILSRTNLFETYEKNFFPNCFTFFDQGNYFELSKKILSVKSKKENLLKARSNFNSDSNVKTYVDCLMQNKNVSNFVFKRYS